MATRVIRTERCEKCKWKGDQIQPGKFECRESPPTVTSIPVQQRPGAPPGFMAHTTFPIVQPDYWCGRFRPNIEGVN